MNIPLIKTIEAALSLKQAEVEALLLSRIAPVFGISADDAKLRAFTEEDDENLRDTLLALVTEWQQSAAHVKEAKEAFNSPDAITELTFSQWTVGVETSGNPGLLSLQLRWGQRERLKLKKSLQFLCPEDPNLRHRAGIWTDGWALYLHRNAGTYQLGTLHPFTEDNLRDIRCNWGWRSPEAADQFVKEITEAPQKLQETIKEITEAKKKSREAK